MAGPGQRRRGVVERGGKGAEVSQNGREAWFSELGVEGGGLEIRGRNSK